ncbi:MAG: hypothetical protein HY074_00620 [Deltaproteobacteria bacterium]|nr:hypothetical protein [Deltaproteobacteria bacterium]
MKLRLSMAFFFLLAFAAAAPVKYPPAKFPIDTRVPGPTSRYTPAILALIRGWHLRPAQKPSEDGNPVQMKCVETAGNERFVGVEQSVLIAAPVARVAAVLDDFDHYKDLSPGFKDIHVVARDGNMTQTFWEKSIPFFFMPNMKYAMTYLSDRSAPARVMYRYQLKESEQLRSADGLIVAENGGGRMANAVTQFTRFDYIDPSLGIFASAPVGTVWQNSLEDIYLSSAGIKLKAEHASWSYEKIVEQAKSWLEEYPVAAVRARCAAHGTL